MNEPQRIDIRKTYEDGSIGTPTIIDYEVEEFRNRIIDPDELLIKEEKITILFTYPLSIKVKFEFENKGGFTRLDLFRCIYEGYKKIYDEEEEEVGDPGTYDRLYNRRKSNGKYGIWGHYIDDLFLEIIFYDPIEKLCTLAIGS